MKRIVTIAATACGLASLAVAVSAAPALAQKQISIVYEEPKNPELRPFYQKLRKLQVLLQHRDLACGASSMSCWWSATSSCA